MPDRTLPAYPDLDQYKKQAKELLASLRRGDASALSRAARSLPLRNPAHADASAAWQLADAQLMLAREHAFPSWPKFAAHVTTVALERSVAALTDPVHAFMRAASVPREGDHAAGTLKEAEMILARYPQVRQANIYTAALLGDEAGVRKIVASDAGAASVPGGVYHWDPLTYLCFSRYLRIERNRSAQFVRTARVLLEAGAAANTGWWETIDHPNPRQIIESAIYGAAGIAQDPELTRLLLEHGADPNDEETCYHAAENWDHDVLQVLLASGKLNATSLTTLLVRKADWHDEEGMRMVLDHGADPNAGTRWLVSGLHHAVRRDNSLPMLQLLLDHGADPTLPNQGNGQTALAMAAHRGRADALKLFAQRGWKLPEDSREGLLSACALGESAQVGQILEDHPEWRTELLAWGGTLLAEFAGNGNTGGVRCLLDAGVDVDALFSAGDGYWDVARGSTALHAAAWRGRHGTVKLLLERGAAVNALDGKGRTPLMLAIRACVDSYWQSDRQPDSVRMLLEAGASTAGVVVPSGYDEIDALLRAHGAHEAGSGDATTPD